ncbi:MAG: pilus assembly protein [bacterium]
MRTIIQYYLNLIFFSVVVFAVAFPKQATADIAQVPLETLVTATPNVMIFIDNSPSMGSISVHPDYDSSTHYPEWQTVQSSQYPATGTLDDDYVLVDHLLPGSCPVGYIQGTRESLLNCLRLPGTFGGGSQYSRQYLNFLFETFPSGANLAQQQHDGSWIIPRTTRLSELKQSARVLISKLEHTRICLASFNQVSPELEILHQCSNQHTDILNRIDSIELKTSGLSPLGKAYLQIHQYFAGQYHDVQHSSSFSSPIQYRCQGNGVIIFSDGIEFPTETTINGSTHNLTSAARYAQQTDLIAADQFDAAGRSFGTGSAEPGREQSTDTAPFAQQNVVGFFVSGADGYGTMDEAANNTDGVHVESRNIDTLASLAHRVLRKHLPGTKNVAPIATSISADGTLIAYRAFFDTRSWSSTVQAYLLNRHSDAAASVDPLWQQGNELPEPQQRRIMTVIPEESTSHSESTLQPTLFHWNQLSRISHQLPGYSDALVEWFRGDRDREQSNGGTFRDRNGVLGDIVHSKPAVLPSIPDQDYPDADYQSFMTQMGMTRSQPVVFFSGNDGALHGFSGGTSGGEEVFAFIPWTVLPQLAQLSDPNYRHRFLFDGPLTLVDARIGSEPDQNPWRSILLAPFGAGGKGLVALDVTDPLSFELRSDRDLEKIFLWEIIPELSPEADSPESPYSAMGHILSPSSIIRTRNEDLSETWYAVTGNGIGSQSNQSVIYVIDLETGLLDHQLTVPPGVKGGITSVTPVDLNDDTFIDRLYAADLSGNIWRFDWNSAQQRFDSYFHNNGDPHPLFTASAINPESSQHLSQAITAGFEVGQLPGKGIEGGIILFFGTGRHFDYRDLPSDNIATDPVNSIYALWDSGTVGGLDRTRLTNLQFVESNTGNVQVRVIEGRTPRFDINGDLGWVLDLPGGTEKIAHPPALLHGRIQFTTVESPTSPMDPCRAEPGGWIIEANAFTGQDPEAPIFDINLDGRVDQHDRTPDNNTPAGIKLEEGLSSPPAIVTVGNNGDSQLLRLSGGSEGELSQSNSPIKTKRIAWRSLE